MANKETKIQQKSRLDLGTRYNVNSSPAQDLQDAIKLVSAAAQKSFDGESN